jgi:hypothetical protein
LNHRLSTRFRELCQRTSSAILRRSVGDFKAGGSAWLIKEPGNQLFFVSSTIAASDLGEMWMKW